MNFLAHDIVLPPNAPAVLRIAAAVPDFWAMLPKRPLPRTLRAAARASADPAVRAVGDGIAAHLHADATFHRHPTFVQRLGWLEEEFRAIWPTLGSPELGAHLMIEMLLDRSLLRDDPGLPDRYYASFRLADIAFVSAHAATGPESQQVLASVLENFAASRFLADYSDEHLLVTRFARRMERIRFASATNPPVDRILSRIDHWSHTLEPGSVELLEAVRCAVWATIEAS